MPVIRVKDDGKRMINWSRKVAMVAAGISLAGLWHFYTGHQADGIMLTLSGGVLASIWNLADDS